MLRRHEKFSGQKSAARYTSSANRHFRAIDFSSSSGDLLGLLHGCRTLTPGCVRDLLLPPTFYLQIRTFTSGADGIRTHALRRAKAALSQLSYGPKTRLMGRVYRSCAERTNRT